MKDERRCERCKLYRCENHQVLCDDCSVMKEETVLVPASIVRELKMIQARGSHVWREVSACIDRMPDAPELSQAQIVRRAKSHANAIRAELSGHIPAHDRLTALLSCVEKLQVIE